ncbi:hypothetical protein QV65_32800, partial [Rhodococcus erythropolis]
MVQSSPIVTAARGRGIAGPGGGDMSSGPGGCLVMVSESVGDDRGRHVENVLMDRGDAAWDGGNAERPDQGAKGFRVHRLTRAA